MQYYVTMLDENLREESQDIREFDGSKKDFAKLLGEQELAKLEAGNQLVCKVSGRVYSPGYKLTLSPNSATISKISDTRGIVCSILVEEDPSHRWDKLLEDLRNLDEHNEHPRG